VLFVSVVLCFEAFSFNFIPLKNWNENYDTGCVMSANWIGREENSVRGQNQKGYSSSK